MERHFILPATIAAALHAGLLFGFRTHTIVVPPSVAKIIRWQPVDQLAPELPPPREPDEEILTRPKGLDGEPPPSLVERPDSRERDFPIEIPRHDPSPRTTATPTIPPGLIGDPKGPDLPGLGGPPMARIVDLDNVPHARLQTAPVYPVDAKRAGLSGEVLVEFSVDETGVVFEPRVVRSSDRVFEESALRAVARWRFEPGKRSGRPVRFKMSVPIVFNLSDN